MTYRPGTLHCESHHCSKAPGDETPVTGAVTEVEQDLCEVGCYLDTENSGNSNNRRGGVRLCLTIAVTPVQCNVTIC